MNVEDMFGATNGIYTHANNSGPLWERPCSIELLNPDGSTGVQADAGIQMHGGGSRARTQKHPFRVQFKGKYGPTKLQFQFFPDSAAGLAEKPPQQREVARAQGYLEPPHFLAMFRYVSERAYEKGTLRDYLKANS